jgi:hypothetical protein
MAHADVTATESFSVTGSTSTATGHVYVFLKRLLSPQTRRLQEKEQSERQNLIRDDAIHSSIIIMFHIFDYLFN